MKNKRKFASRTNQRNLFDGDSLDIRILLGNSLYSFSSSTLGETVDKCITRIAHNFLTLPPHKREIENILDFQVESGDPKITITDPEIAKEIKEISESATVYLKKQMTPIIQAAMWEAVSEAFVQAVLERRGTGVIDPKATQIQAVTAFGRRHTQMMRERMSVKKESGTA